MILSFEILEEFEYLGYRENVVTELVSSTSVHEVILITDTI